MNIFASIIASAAVVASVNASAITTAAAEVYNPAAAYLGQFSGARLHIETEDRSVRNLGQEYIDAAHGTFRAQTRTTADAVTYDPAQNYINRN